jgi:hypothetical protein
MMTEAESRFERLRTELIGRRIKFRRLAGDSLLLYVDCEPGDQRGITIWLEPIWHLRGPLGVLLGSMQVAEAADEEETMAAVADEPLSQLIGKAIEDVAFDALTFDITVRFEGGYRVCTFVADATSDDSWHIRENRTLTRVKGSPAGLVFQRPRVERDDRCP